MKLTKKKKIVLLLVFLASLFPLFMVFVYFVPLNVVWISADKEVESQLKIYLYQGSEMTVSQYRQYRQEEFRKAARGYLCGRQARRHRRFHLCPEKTGKRRVLRGITEENEQKSLNLG